MGKGDPKQATLSLEARRNRGALASDGLDILQTLEDMDDPDITLLLLNMQDNLTFIDRKLLTLIARVDKISAKVDKWEKRLSDDKAKTLSLKYDMAGHSNKLLDMAKVLKVIRTKNKDLEARFQHNN
ncbi:hypothetical protein NDU88_007042 [Pleurodeles waltl]|uniref:Uncharacterized protein n=1 Tax=Pleurodeles waltl TaxID=8319 RepID=A0AAV7UPC1_PLEWA|nr:hypothetical protein NDU88_007042 [Pleurodeles waltl]